MGKNVDRNDALVRGAEPRAILPGTYSLPRAVLDPHGILWTSLTQAARAYRLTAPAIKYRAANRVCGWSFADAG